MGVVGAGEVQAGPGSRRQLLLLLGMLISGHRPLLHRTATSLDLRIAWSDLSCGSAECCMVGRVEGNNAGEAKGQGSPAGECLRAEAARDLPTVRSP